MPFPSANLYGDLCRSVSLPRDGPPDLTDAWPAHCWWYYVELEKKTELRQQLAQRIVERRLRQSKALVLSAPPV